MQDNYIGDIGDYGKYGFLREVCAEGLSLFVNWYRVIPTKKGKQDDGKFISYLLNPQKYRTYDPDLFDAIKHIVIADEDRRIARIEQAQLFQATFFTKELKDRKEWHRQALEQAKGADVVFLDPDNGLETIRMHRKNCAKSKHVKWEELKDYYEQGQNVILYQHRSQGDTKEACIEKIMHFQNEYLMADSVRLLEFPKYTNRFYFIFLHQKDAPAFKKICSRMTMKWGKDRFCHEIQLGEQYV